MKKLNCQRHGNYLGKVFMLGGKRREPICPVCKAEQDQTAASERDEQIAQQRRTSLTKLLGHSGIPPRFMMQGFDTYEVRNSHQAEALDIAKKYALNFSEMRAEGKGLLLIGSTGTGKTHLTTAICKSVIRDGFTAYFTSILEVMQVIKETYGSGKEMSEREAIAKFAEPDLIAIDELGVQHQSPTEKMFLTQIINKRYEHMKPTILLSNLAMKSVSGDDLTRVLDERVISRLKEVSKTVFCDWEDYRARTR